MAKQKAFCIVHATDFQVWKNETLAEVSLRAKCVSFENGFDGILMYYSAEVELMCAISEWLFVCLESMAIVTRVESFRPSALPLRT